MERESQIKSLDQLEREQRFLTKVIDRKTRLWNQVEMTGLLGSGGVFGDSSSIAGLIKVGQLREKVNQRLAQDVQGLTQVTSQVDKLRSTHLLIETAERFLYQLVEAKVGLRVVKNFVDRKLLGSAELETAEAEYCQLRLKGEQDDKLKEGIRLWLKQEGEALARPIGEERVIVELGQLEVKAPPEEIKITKSKKPGMIYETTLPSGGIVEVKGKTRAKALEVIKNTSEENTINFEEIARQVYGEVNINTLGNSYSMIAELRKDLLPQGLTIIQPTTIRERSKGIKGYVYLKKIYQAEVKETEEQPLVDNFQIQLPPLPATATAEREIEVISIPYEPSSEEVRSRNETIVLKVITDGLRKSVRLWMNLLAEGIADLRLKDSLSSDQTKAHEVSADRLKYDFEKGYNKMLNESEVDELRLRWDEEDEKLWEDVQHLKTTILRVKDDKELIRRVRSTITAAATNWREEHEGKEFRRIING